MKINWKVRIRHRQFWIAIISAAVLLANQVASILGYDITLISAKIQQLLESMLLILALLGIIIDPTTEGVKDSTQVMVYEKPRCEEDEVQKIVGTVLEKPHDTKIEIQKETKTEEIQQHVITKEKK